MPRYVLVRFLRADNGAPLQVGQVVRLEDATSPHKRYGQCDVVARINGADVRKSNVSSTCAVELREDS